MASRAESRAFGALTGLFYVVLVFVGSALLARTNGPGRHSLDASAADVREYLAEADTARVWLGEYVGALGFLLFLPFSAYLLTTLARSAGDRDWLRSTAAAAAAVYVSLSLAAIAALAPALNRGGEAATHFLDLRTTLIALAFVALGVWLLTVGALALGASRLPRWLAWAAIAIGALLILGAPLATQDPAFTGLPTFASFLWVLIVSVLLFRRRGPVTASRAGACRRGVRR
jgi:hypothetical protein